MGRGDVEVHDGEAVDLLELADELLADMPEGRSGRAARTLSGGHGFRQVLLVLRAGNRLDDHRAPGPSSLVVLRGAADLTWEGGECPLHAGDWTRVPDALHAVAARSDAVLLLTVPRANET